MMEELARQAGPQAARGRLILAHLGNGASRIATRVMHTDEEWTVAKMVCSVLGLSIGKGNNDENEKS